MNRYSVYLCAILFCYSCGSEAPPVTTPVQQVMKDAGFTPNDEVFVGMYKRYTGTIAGQPVVVNLTQYDDKVQAEYYYEKTGQPITLYQQHDSTIADSILFLAEDTPGSITDEPAHWEIQISGDSITGTWVSGTGDKTYPILLAEHYSDDVQQLGIISIHDSVRYKDSIAHPQAEIQYQVLLPVGKDETSLYVRSVIFNSINCSEPDTGSIRNCMDSIKQQYFDNYRSATDELEPEQAFASFNNWSLDVGYTVVYNQNNLLVLDNHSYEYTGGAHGNYSSQFINIDRAGKRILKLADIMRVDSSRLLQLLEVQARIHFDLDEKQALSSRMFSNELHIPDNFYISSKGITFVYGLYEIASYADGIIELYVPYNKITDMLAPEFRQRMHLESIAAK